MAFSAFLAIVRHFEAKAIGISEKRRPVIRRIVGVERGFRGCNASCLKLAGNGHHVSDGLNAKAEMMKPGSVGIVLYRVA